MSFIQLANVDGNLETQTGPIGGSSNFQSYSTNFFSGCMQSTNPWRWNSNFVSGNLPNALGTGPFTISFWLYPNQENYGDQDIFGIGDTDSNRLGLQLLNLNNGTFKLKMEYGGPSQTTTTTINESAWSHILITRDVNNTLTLFINGNMAIQVTSNNTNLDSKFLQLFYYKQSIGLTGKITGFSVSLNVWITTNFTPNAHPINNDPSMQVILNASSSDDFLTNNSSYDIQFSIQNIQYGSDYPKVITEIMT